MNDANNAIAATPDETIVTIPWDQLHDSPLQYRQTYSDATIAEIAASIKDTGRIHQPLVVRLRYPNPLFRDQYDPQDGFEVVFGHTRKRGGMLAGLAGGPCVVRNLNDAQVRAAQAAENIARADVHPLEEAAGFRAILDEDQLTADELAASLGKSRSYVYARLKLLALCPEVRQAVLAGDIDTEVGLLVARVGNAKMQGKALARIKSKYYSLEDGGKKSYRQVRDLLNEYFTLDLATAIFDVNDEGLLLSAGYCGRCPKRSGNAPEFSDIVDPPDARRRNAAYGTKHVGADVCTDPECFDAKKKAHLAREASKLEASGKVVISGNKARAAMGAGGDVKGAYVEASKVRELIKQTKTAAGKGVTMPQVVLIQDQRTGKTVQAVSRAELQQLGAKLPAEASPRSSGNSAADQAKRAAERAENERKVLAENTERLAMLAAVRTAMRATERSAWDLRMVARTAFAGVEWGDRALLAELWGCRAEHEVEKRIDELELADVTQFVLDCGLVNDVRIRDAYYIKDKPKGLLAAAKHYGIAATPAPSTAGASAKTAKAGAGAKQAQTQADPKTQDAGSADDKQNDGAGVAGGCSTAGGQLDAFAGAAA